MLSLRNFGNNPDPKLFLIYHTGIHSKHSGHGEIFVNFLCFVFEILAVEVCIHLAPKVKLESNRCDVIDAH